MGGLSGLLSLQIPPLPIPAPAMNALVAATAAMSASISAPAMPTVPGMSATASAKLSLLGALSASGMMPLNVSAAALLKPLILSLNANLPAFPAMPALSLPGLLGALMVNVQGVLGINLASPGAAALLQAKLDASAKVVLAATLPMPALPNMSVSASALLSATARMGLNLQPLDPLPQISALVSLFVGLNLPPITALPTNLLALLAALANIKLGLGVNLLSPGAAAALVSAIARIDMTAMAALKVTANLMLPTVSVAAATTASASFSAALDLALAPLHLPTLTGLHGMISLTASLKALGLGLPVTPCQVCAFLKAAV